MLFGKKIELVFEIVLELSTLLQLITLTSSVRMHWQDHTPRLTPASDGAQSGMGFQFSPLSTSAFLV